MIFYSVQDLIEEAQRRSTVISTVVKELEAKNSEESEEIIQERMFRQWLVMKESAHIGLNNPKISMGGLIGGQGKKLNDYCQAQKTLAGPIINKAVSRALAVAEVNASMGRIVAAPTAGSCGILPGVLLTMQEELELPDVKIVDALFTASGIGIVIAQKASISGAEGGCQAECGAAAAMAAGALVELAGGSPKEVGEACAMVLKNVLGLVCDPVAGLVEVPCAKRNALGTSLAIISADMALAGIESVIPVDEVIITMGEVGCALPASLRETAKGGLATTATGKRLAKDFSRRKNPTFSS